jgi:DNA-binding XRE family transcriptional regulator
MSTVPHLESGTVSDTIPSEIIPDNYPNFIINLRKEFGFPQSGLAKRLGVSKSSVCRWEKGLCKPPLSKWRVLHKIHKADNFFDRYVCVFDEDLQKELLVKEFFNKLYPVLIANKITPDKVKKIIGYGADDIIEGKKIDIDDLVKLLASFGYRLNITVEPI